ncbi:MAG TPA: type IV pilus biogenesis/stability protein PilW [Dokdonella sp.]
MRPDSLLRHALLAVLLAVLAGCATGGGDGMKKETAESKRAEAARVNTDLGQQYMRQGKLELALEKLNRALQFDSGYVDAHTVIAVLYETIGDSAKAGEHYRRAAELKPKGGAVNNNYGWFLCRSGKFAEAQAYFERALADPFYKTPSLALSNSGSCLYKAGRRDEAEKALRHALDLDPGDPEALLQLGNVLYDKGEYFNARAFVQRFEGLSSARPDALLLGRNVELRLGNGDAAREYTRRLLQTFPDSEQARLLGAQGRQ